MKTYIGIKMIQASPGQKDGQDGYNVIYPDGYASWSPKDVFEASYMPLTSPTSICQADIDSLNANMAVQDLDDKTALLKAELITGFVLYETASCVAPENYSQEIGARICSNRINEKVWFAMGFILQWAKYGLQHVAKQGENNGNIE